MDYPQLTFEQPDRETFQNLNLAFVEMDREGTAACALNAANEVTVQAFLKGEIGFLDIARINGNVMDQATFVKEPEYADFVKVDEEARRLAEELVKLQHGGHKDAK
jgi:1-deoxy-D-xylulose-5-phosphate reductoisomerase